MAATGAAPIVPLKQQVDEALKETPAVKRVIVFRRANNEVHIEEGRDVWWHREMEYVNATCPPVPLDSEHPLFILYTSGSTGKPKGILHTTGGYLLGAYMTCKYVFDLREEDLYWCTADIGWVTGHSYVVYGPLANGATTFMYEGAPNCAGLGPLVEAHRGIPHHHPLHRAHRHPRLHQGRRRIGRRSTISPRCACSAASASRSIPRPGCGITSVIGGGPLPDRRYLVADGDRRPS